MTSRSPDEALDRLFEVIRQEATKSPSFAKRLLEAVGFEVTFTGSDAIDAADPIAMAARMEYDGFRESLMTFEEKDLKALLKNYTLATDEQVKSVKTRPKKDGYVELLWRGSRRRLEEGRGK